eukprot:7453460-Karenia_brevis.AAC.1
MSRADLPAWSPGVYQKPYWLLRCRLGPFDPDTTFATAQHKSNPRLVPAVTPISKHAIWSRKPSGNQRLRSTKGN